MGWKTKAKMLWKEDSMKELLVQIRRQQGSFGFLLQVLQVDSMSDLTSLIRDNRELLERLANSTTSLRRSYPGIRVPESIFDASAGDGVSMFSGPASTAGATEFDFDDLIVDSKVYRKAFLGGYLKPRRVLDQDDNSSDAATVINENADSAIRLPEIEIHGGIPPGVVTQVAKKFVLEVDAPAGGRLEMDAAQVSELLAKYDELDEKYRKVKRMYFEKYAEVARLEDQIKYSKAIADHKVDHSQPEAQMQFAPRSVITKRNKDVSKPTE